MPNKEAAAGRPQVKSGQTENRLVREKSPYLLQHAHNPVDWYPWGPEAFEKAKRENKPIFLSIGYSTCHWCHVMAHESFENPEVARLLNEAFVCIKVDREERPDIDSVYMSVCQMLTGSGGWPLTIIMTPDRQPFFAATYIARESRFGRTGLLDLVPRISQAWENRREELVQSAGQITQALQKSEPEPAGAELDGSALKAAFDYFKASFDPQHGGFGQAPKFPTPHNLMMLLRYWKRAADPSALDMVETTLRKMRLGGIYDHVGFGFHRYSTDPQWLVPHFEKMLYDQALLTMAYAEAYQAAGKAEFAETAREIIAYVLRDMTAPDGGFYSAEDADSEGEEGKFYVWTVPEVQKLLTRQEAQLAVRAYTMDPAGNFADEASGHRKGGNILHLNKPLNTLSAEMNISETELKAQLERLRLKLFDRRCKRIHPHKDDKILTDWNGLMIAALAKTGRALDEPQFTRAAQKAVSFIMAKLRTGEGRLLHRYRDGEAAVPGQVDDYAFMIWGLIELYQSTFEVKYLQDAVALNRVLYKHFWDSKSGAYFTTADDAEKLLVRQKEIYDGAVPSGNSVAALNLLRLGRITADPALEERAAIIGRVFFESAQRAPFAHTQLMAALDFAVGPAYELVIAGRRDAADTQQIIKAARSRFIPNMVMIFHPEGDGRSEIEQISKFIQYQTAVDNKATAYVCLNHSCQKPTTDISQMLKLLNIH